MATVQESAAEAAPKTTPAAGRWWLFKKRVLQLVLTYAGLALAPFCFPYLGSLSRWAFSY